MFIDEAEPTVKQVDFGMIPNVGLERCHRSWRPSIVGQQNRDKVGLRGGHPGIERARQLASAICDDSGARLLSADTQHCLMRDRVVRFDDPNQPPS